MTFFCPSCWSEIKPSDSRCPQCAADVRNLDAQSFPQRLRAALKHPEPQTAVRAAWILGERHEQTAVDDLIDTLATAADGFLAEAAAEALGKIGDAAALPALTQAASAGTLRVRIASQRAVELIEAQRRQLLPEEKS